MFLRLMLFDAEKWSKFCKLSKCFGVWRVLIGGVNILVNNFNPFICLRVCT